MLVVPDTYTPVYVCIYFHVPTRDIYAYLGSKLINQGSRQLEVNTPPTGTNAAVWQTPSTKMSSTMDDAGCLSVRTRRVTHIQLSVFWAQKKGSSGTSSWKGPCHRSICHAAASGGQQATAGKQITSHAAEHCKCRYLRWSCSSGCGYRPLTTGTCGPHPLGGLPWNVSLSAGLPYLSVVAVPDQRDSDYVGRYSGGGDEV